MNAPRSALAAALVFVGCGGDGGSQHSTPDAFVITDASPDARVCGSASSGTLDFLGYDPDGVIAWGGPMTGDLGDGLSLEYQFQFYDNIEASLANTFDLHAGNQANYSTCAICILAFGRDANNQVVKQYFQAGGSITLSEDPFTNRHLIASIQNLQLEEVTIDQQTFTSTPVAGGTCANVPAFTVDHDRVPNAWTCAHAEWDSGTNCDCMCGISDPDCALANPPVVGCTSSQTCFNAMCVTPPANDTCALAAPITIGTPVNGTTAGAGKNYNSGLEGMGCTGYPQPGPDVVYSVDLAANQTITVTLSNVESTYDPAVALLGPAPDATICDASPITTCVKGADANLDGMDETFMYTATAAGTYYIVVDAYSATEGGTFTLTVTSM